MEIFGIRVNADLRLANEQAIASNPAEAGNLLKALQKSLGSNYKKNEKKFDDTTFQTITWSLDGAKVTLTLKKEDRFGATLYFMLSSPDINIAGGEGRTAREAIIRFLKNVANFNKQTGSKARATRTRDAKAVKIMNDLAKDLKSNL